MPVQTSYQERLDPAVAGQVANQVPATFISRTVETTGGIGFGIAVTQGTEDYGCITFDGGTEILGITARERSLDANTPDKFDEGDNARIMTKGAIWVTASVAVDAGDSVYVTDAGAFTNVSSGNTELVGARWDTSTTGEALAIVRIG